jgi:hypothetical protein
MLIPPAASGAGWFLLLPTEPGKPKSNRLQLIQLAALGSAKMFMNGELTVTNLIPPVNRLRPL